MRILTPLVTLFLLGLVPALSAGAGGTWLYTVQESYDPGDEVIAVGYVGAEIPEEPLLARMTVAPSPPNEEVAAGSWVELGPVTLEPTGIAGYLETRVSITFTLPPDLEPGTYAIDVRTKSGDFFSDLIGGSVIVGPAPPSLPRWVEWALDDPLIEMLPDSDVIAGPGFAVSVAELKAGQYPEGAESFMLHPEELPPVTSTAAPDLILEEPPSQDTDVGVTSIEESHPITKSDGANGIETNAPETMIPLQMAEPRPPSAAASPAGPIWVSGGIALIALVSVSIMTRIRRRNEPGESEETAESERILSRT